MEKFLVEVFDSKITVLVDKSNTALPRLLKVTAAESVSENDDIDALIQKSLHRIGQESLILEACDAQSLISQLMSKPGLYRFDGSRGLEIVDYQCARPTVKVKQLKYVEKKTEEKE